MTATVIAANTSANVVIPPGFILNVAGLGTFQPTPPQPASRMMPPQPIMSPFSSIGPYADPVTITIVALAQPVTYDFRAFGEPVEIGSGDIGPDTVFESCPNITFTDSTTPPGIGLVATQAAFATIPGYWMRERTRLVVGAILDAAGNDSKDVQFRIGPASGNFTTALQFGGQVGLTTQRYVGVEAMLWNDNSLQAQRSGPTGMNNWVGTNTANATSTFAVDTTLDWNIYLGVKFNLANGAPTNTFTVRNFFVMPYLR